jgi:hypothetical protein
MVQSFGGPGLPPFLLNFPEWIMAHEKDPFSSFVNFDNWTFANFSVRPELVEGRTAPFTLRQAQRERFFLGFSKFAKVQLSIYELHGRKKRKKCHAFF